MLIVEDEEDIMELLQLIFDKLDKYAVFAARNGEEALRVARAHSPDIVLLDIHLPGLNGYQVCKIIKADHIMSHTKVIMLTGMTQYSDLDSAQEAGADGYVAKPFNMTELLQKVEGLLSS